MSSATTGYAESVGSSHPPTRLLRSPLPAGDALHPLPARRRLDFPASGGLDDEDDDDFLCNAAEEMERNHQEAKRRATQGPAPPTPVPPAFREKQCICARGPCDVVWQERGGWAYVCSAPPKCSFFAWCEESELNPNSQPAFRSHPESSNPYAFNTPSNHRALASTPFNVRSQGVSAPTPVNNSPQGVGAPTPVNNSPQGVGAPTPVNVSPEDARSNGWPICKCTAGKCRKLTIKGVDFYTCPIPKGQGACPYRVQVNAASEQTPQTGNNSPGETKHLEYNPVKEAIGRNLVKIGENNENGPVNPDQPEDDDEWPFDIVDGDIVPKSCSTPAQPTPFAVVAQESPSMLHQPIATVELKTPTKSPMPPTGTISPITPRSNFCFRCGEEGHWSRNCPSPCYRCKEVGHRSRDCPEFSPQPNTCFHCGEVGHWKISCPVLRDKRGF